MCGILFWACTSSSAEDVEFQQLTERLRQANALRGPDSQQSFRHTLAPVNHSTGGGIHAGGADTVLEFYASELRLRGDYPVVQPHQKDGDVLCWNGEIFEGLNVLAQENDGAKLFEILRTCRTEDQLREVFARIEGPYAFVYYEYASRRLYFARDPLGRRSLLIHKPTEEQPYFILSSVAVAGSFEMEELGTEYIFYIDFSAYSGPQKSFVQEFHVHAIARTSLASHGRATLARVNPTSPPNDWPQINSLDTISPELVTSVDDLLVALDYSVMLRVRDIPQYMETKGKARVAVLFSGGIDSTIIAALAHRHVALNEPIDLLNVAFENPRKIRVQREGNDGGPNNKKLKKELIDEPVNVSYMVPDRITGLQEVEEFRRLYPERTWNLVEINVPYQESQAARPHVESLLLPSRTVMDMSLGLALYFAARGIGQIKAGDETVPYTTPARVLLNGLGSDELLGGYGRHRTAYGASGWTAVIEELQLEIDRIPTRNLGRDDRVISSQGKETRHPFLSLDVVSFLAQLPVHYKMDPRANVGTGDKMLLRLAARKLGLVEASSRKKRAMQFGSRSARMEGEKRGDLPLE